MTSRTRRDLIRTCTWLTVAALAVSCGSNGATEPTTTATDPTLAIPTVESIPEQTTPTQSGEPSTSIPATAPSPGGPDGDEPPVVVPYWAPETDLLEPASAEIIEFIATADDHSMLITFWAGVEECFGLVRAEARESDREVAVEVVVGRRPPAEEPCMASAHEYATAVELEQPVGERQVLDAAAPIEMPNAPDEYAMAVFDAWAAGDTDMLARLTSDRAFDALSDRPWSDTDGWDGLDCEGAAGSTFCSWESEGERLVLRVANEPASAATPDAVVEATFTPTD